MRRSLTLFAATAVLALPAVPSFANRAAADACAGRLSSDAKLIYAATIGSVAPGANLPDTVRAKARELVMAGKIKRDQAKPAAQAAGACLKQAM
jgi:hypothetical protein